MKIIVAIKQVPERDAPIRIGGTGKWIDESDIEWALNESDAYALEEALLLKEKSGDPASEVIVLSAGPEVSRFAKGLPRAPTAPSTSSPMIWPLAMPSAWPACSPPQSRPKSPT
jgi:hypothetical protein